MSNAKDLLGERGRSQEAEYFRRRDQELLNRARDVEAAAARLRQLATALGIEDDAAVGKLAAFGFDAGTAPLLSLVPAIQVAWADGSLPAKERAEIERILARLEMKEAAAMGSKMVAQWLSRQPPADLYRVAIEVIQLRLARFDDTTRKRLITTLLEDCNAVAAASGGVFGLGAHSNAESARIKELAAALGVKD